MHGEQASLKGLVFLKLLITPVAKGLSLLARETPNGASGAGGGNQAVCTWRRQDLLSQSLGPRPPRPLRPLGSARGQNQAP